ncbi:acyltransferase [Treponema primitia]|uniref:acyltransferase n=1 Tax=Treponema primitia TaxID=88058 RepID=UPI0003097263|nr:acyltransferase [Treponema primitia]
MIKLLARIYLFIFLGIARIVLRGDTHFFRAFQRALRGDSRCILAFRHPNGGEPQLLTWFILFRLRGLAKKAGFPFARSPHALFIYGYDVLRWGGWVARLVMPRVGGMPIHHTKLDSQGMTRIFKAMKEGPYPIAIAPEGQVTYNTEQILNLEQGTMRIGFHSADQLRKEGKSYPVEILPISIHFRYGAWGKMCLSWLMKRLDRFTGYRDRYKKDGLPDFTLRLRNCRDYLITQNEIRYGLPLDEKRDISERMNCIMEAALDKAEKILGISPAADGIMNRVYNIRQISWDRIYLPGQESLDGLSQVERSLLDLRAGEAWYAGRHGELVDFLWYFRSPIPEEESPLHLKIEYAQNLWDLANRTMGGSYATRNINIYPRRVIIQAAEPINLTDRLPEYNRDRKSAIQSAMDDLLKAYMGCIEEVNKAD